MSSVDVENVGKAVFSFTLDGVIVGLKNKNKSFALWAIHVTEK